MRNLIIISSVLAAFLSVSPEAFGQFNSSSFITNRRAQTNGVRSVASNILARPTTSPYLALTDLTGVGRDASVNYFTNVRPQLENQQNQQQQSISIQRMQRDVSAMRSAAAQRSQSGARATGHPTRFGFYLQYYPGLNR